METKRDILQREFSHKFKERGFFGIANLCPRFGKIKFSLNCITDEQNIRVAYNEINIKKSWLDDLKFWKTPQPERFKFTTYASFKNLKEPCDVLILDEIHAASPAQLDSIAAYINKFGIKKVIALSGTISDSTEIEILQKTGLKIVIKYPIEQGIRDGVISDYRIEVITTPLSTIKNLEVKWKGPSFFVSEKGSFDRLTQQIAQLSMETFPNYKTLKMKRLSRMGIIKKSQSKVELTKRVLGQFKGQRVLVFAGLTEIADSFGIPSYHSKNNDEDAKDKFLASNIDKIAIVNKLGTGVTFPNLDIAIVNFFTSSSEDMAQKISRITNLDFKGKVARIIIISSNEAVELQWLAKALSFFEQSKITYR